jgi:hypothetical protein
MSDGRAPQPTRWWRAGLCAFLLTLGFLTYVCAPFFPCGSGLYNGILHTAGTFTGLGLAIFVGDPFRG